MQERVAQWVKRVGSKPIPVLGQTLAELGRLIDQDQLPLARIGAVVRKDPGLTVQLLRACNNVRHGRLQSEVTAVEPALLMLGTDQVRRMPAALPVLDKVLRDPGRHLLLQTYNCAYHAAVQAMDWADLRRDMSPEEVFIATQLHFVGDMVLAVFGPELAQQVVNLMRASHVSPSEAQYVTLGFTIDQLSLALAQHWRMPSLVLDSLNAENALQPRALGIMLAVQLARVADHDWYSEDMQSLLVQVAEYLHHPLDAVVRRIHATAVEAARNSIYGVRPAAALLPMLPAASPAAQAIHGGQDPAAELCLMPQVETVRQVMEALAAREHLTLHDVMELAMRGMHDGLGLNRVVFAMLSPDRQTLSARGIAGSDNDPVFNRFRVALDRPHLFTRLLEKQQAVWINDTNRARFWPLVPADLRRLIRTDAFFAMSVFVRDKPVGLFYADRHTSACQLDEDAYRQFKLLSTNTSEALAHLSGASAI